MTKKKTKTRSKKPTSKRTTHQAETGPPGTRPPVLFVLGLIFLGLAVVMSLLLVMEHLGGLSLPGCGEGGACEQAANSVWGKVPLGKFEWPVANLGLAYFVAILLTWIATRGLLPSLFKYLVRVGVLISVGYLIIIVVERTFCPYCIGAHLGNIAFWLSMESARRVGATRGAATASFGVTFAVVTIALAVLGGQARTAVREQAEAERSATAREIIDRAAMGDSVETEPPVTLDEQPEEQSSEETVVNGSAEDRPQAETATPEEPDQPVREPVEEVTEDAGRETDPGSWFTGRYRVGPEEAPIRIVMFTDYQCRDCYAIEQQVKLLYEKHNDISISIKHFPFNVDCNPYVGKTMHGNACWAARAAEAAGILWGADGFWKMHMWLFERHGSFTTTQELEDGIRGMGYDPTGFTHVMMGTETLEVVRRDSEEAKELGLHFTPMIFINGVEFKGWSAQNALVRTVEEVAATNPPARTAANDRPPQAFEKYLADWREQPVLSFAPAPPEWVTGPAEADVKVMVWGDYQEKMTAKADSIIRDFASSGVDVEYAYRHFPFNSDCNPKLQDKRHPDACRAARAAEAAGRLGGKDAYWRMHVWLMGNQDNFTTDALGSFAGELGLDADEFIAAMEMDESSAAIIADVQAGSRLPQLRYGMPRGIYSVPSIFVNGRFIPRWMRDDKPVLRSILESAAKE